MEHHLYSLMLCETGGHVGLEGLVEEECLLVVGAEAVCIVDVDHPGNTVLLNDQFYAFNNQSMAYLSG